MPPRTKARRTKAARQVNAASAMALDPRVSAAGSRSPGVQPEPQAQVRPQTRARIQPQPPSQLPPSRAQSHLSARTQRRPPPPPPSQPPRPSQPELETNPSPAPKAARASTTFPPPPAAPPPASVSASASLESAAASVDWDLFATVLSRSARDHRRKSRLSQGSQASPVSHGRASLGSQKSPGEKRSRPSPRLDQSPGQNSGLGHGQASQGSSQATVRPLRSRPTTRPSGRLPSAPTWATAAPRTTTTRANAKAKSSGPYDSDDGDGDDLPASDDSQFRLVGVASLFSEGGSLPAADDSQFDETVRPRRLRQPPSEVEEGGADPDLPGLTDSQFGQAYGAGEEGDDLPGAGDSQSEQGTPRDEEMDDESTPRPLQDSDDDLPAATDSQFEQTHARRAVDDDDDDELSESTGSQFERTPRADRADDDLPSSTDSEFDEDMDDDQGLPASADSQFEQTHAQPAIAAEDPLPNATDSQFEQTQGRRVSRKGSGDSTEMAEAEEALDTLGGEGDGGDMVAAEVRGQAQVEVLEVEEEQVKVVEVVEVIEEVASAQPEPTAASALPASRPAGRSQPSLSQFVSPRVRRHRDDPTEFAPPDEADVTEAERRGEVPPAPEPRDVLHGPRPVRRATGGQKRRKGDVVASQRSSREVRTGVRAARGSGDDRVNDERVGHKEANAIVVDDSDEYGAERQVARRDQMDLEFGPPLDDFYRHNGTRDEAPMDVDEHLEEYREEGFDEELLDEHFPDDPRPATTSRRRRRQASVSSEPELVDPYLVDNAGQPLGPNPNYVVQAGWAPGKSRLHGRKPGQASQYSRLSGHKARFTAAESLLLWRTIQQAPMSVENPVDVAAYFYGEFGVRSNALAQYNKQHMRSRLKTMCETRVNRGLVIEGRARMFLPPRNPLRQEYEEDVAAFREEEQMRIKEEEAAEWGDEPDEQDELDSEEVQFVDEPEFEIVEPVRKRARVQSPPAPRRPRMPVNRAYVELPGPRRTREPGARSSPPRPPAPSPRRRRVTRDEDVSEESDSDPPPQPRYVPPRYHRRRQADFAHVPPFEVVILSRSPSLSASSSSESEPEPAPRRHPRRQSAPERLQRSQRAIRRPELNPIASSDVEEEEMPEEQQEQQEPPAEDAEVELPPEFESEEGADEPLAPPAPLQRPGGTTRARPSNARRSSPPPEAPEHHPSTPPDKLARNTRNTRSTRSEAARGPTPSPSPTQSPTPSLPPSPRRIPPSQKRYGRRRRGGPSSEAVDPESELDEPQEPAEDADEPRRSTRTRKRRAESSGAAVAPASPYETRRTRRATYAAPVPGDTAPAASASRRRASQSTTDAASPLQARQTRQSTARHTSAAPAQTTRPSRTTRGKGRQRISEDVGDEVLVEDENEEQDDDSDEGGVDDTPEDMQEVGGETQAASQAVRRELIKQKVLRGEV